MSKRVTAEEARGLLEGVAPEGWLVEVLPPPSTKPANAAELLADLQRPAAYILDQGGKGTVAEVVVLSDAPVLGAAPSLAFTVVALEAERDEARAERDAYRKAKAENDERFMLERDEARAERDRLRDILACERGEKAPEGWAWEWQTRRWINASISAVVGSGSWFIGIDGPSGTARYLLECVEAADLAAKATP